MLFYEFSILTTKPIKFILLNPLYIYFILFTLIEESKPIKLICLLVGF